MGHPTEQSRGVAWQSRAVLLAVVPACAVWLLLELLRRWPVDRAPVLWGVGISVIFALAVRGARAATAAGACTGGLLACCLYLFVPGLRTALWPLFAMLVLTLGASRVGRARKVALGTSEGKRGRSASQVAANVGAASLAVLLVNSQGLLLAETAMLAALGEAAADTLASELGEVFGGVPRLVTTWRPVAPGTDGGVTVAGTLAGVTGAAVVIAVGALVLRLSAGLGAVVLAAAIVGLIVDSLLGAIIERRGWMNNDAVNFCSTLAAAALALLLGRRVL
jgi:uncharacterized protein (TIGR00297 family)